MDELIHLKLEGEIAELLIRVEPSFQSCAAYEQGKLVVYAELSKALYGTLQASLLFWKHLSNFLIEELGFTVNPYDNCVVNKIINGKQCTIGWYVDDLKISHVEQEVIDSIFDRLQERYGKEAPLSVKRGSQHEYLGMNIDYREAGKVKFSMTKYIERLIDETPAELLKGAGTTPAANHLFLVNEHGRKLDKERADTYHHLVAKLLYLAKRTRPDILLAVSFLTTRVSCPDEDDLAKLGRCIRYLRDTIDLQLTLEASDLTKIRWWVDASFAVHQDYKSHTGGVMMIGKGALYAFSNKQRINTRSSTEAELVGVNDAMGMILWVRNFMEAQGYTVSDNVVFQDNQSAILLEKNGKMSSSKKTRHIEIRYYFITDNIHRGRVRVAYCPTNDMTGDVNTKPLQGSKFRRFRDDMLNIPPNQTAVAGQERVETNENQEPSREPSSPDGRNDWKTVIRKRKPKESKILVERKISLC